MTRACGGRLPLMIAESVSARGGGVHIVGIEGEADPAIARFPHTWVNWGQIGRMVATLREQDARRPDAHASQRQVRSGGRLRHESLSRSMQRP